MAGLAVVAGGSAGAASPTLLALFTTTTTVSASPNIIVSSTGDSDANFVPESTTLTANVVESPLPNGLLITPLGTVTFSATDNHGDHLSLGTASLKGCLLTLDQCTASLSSGAFYVAAQDLAQENGTAWAVTATYAGGLVAKGSSGTTTVTSLAGDSSSCASDTGCNSFSYNADDTAGISLEIPCTTNCESDGPNQKVSNTVVHPTNANASGEIWTGFGAPAMSAPAVSPCQAAGDDLDGSGSSINAYTEFATSLVSAANPAQMTYFLFGDPALAQGPSSSFCYGAITDFTQANGSAAPFDQATQQFVGVLPDCSTGDLPCSTNMSYVPNGGEHFGGPEWSIIIFAANDPTAGRH
jgi:hypothetical protein